MLTKMAGDEADFDIIELDESYDTTAPTQQSGQFSCPICQAHFFSETGVEVHINVVHDGVPARPSGNFHKIPEGVRLKKSSGLQDGQRKPITEYFAATPGTAAEREGRSAPGPLRARNNVEQQLAERAKLEQQRFRSGGKTTTRLNSHATKYIPYQEVIIIDGGDDDVPEIAQKPVNETDEEMARRLQLAEDEEVMDTASVRHSGSTLKDSDILNDLDNFVADDDDIVMVPPDQDSAFSDASPDRPYSRASDRPSDRPSDRSKTDNTKAVPYVDPGYDLSKVETQLLIFSHPNSDPGQSSSFGIRKTIDRNTSEDPNVGAIKLCVDCGHFASDSEDYGFSCGYRNTQVVISAMYYFPDLRRRLVEELGGVCVPSISKLQALIERGWRDGWDPQGRMEHKGKLVGGRRWIGPVDLHAMFMAMGIDCKIVSFVHRHPNPGPHPKLFDWVDQYFAGADSVPVLPVYLQYDGHSQTIIGVEQRKNSTDRCLLVFDPAVTQERIRATRGNEIRWLNETVRRPLGRLSKPNYQVLVFSGRILNQTELGLIKAQTGGAAFGERIVS